MMRETLKQDVKAVWRRFFCGGIKGPFSIKALADDVLSEARLRKLGEPDDVKAPDVGDIRHLLPRLVAENPSAALAFLDEALGLHEAGILMHFAQKPGVAVSLVKETAEAGAAVGRAQAVALRIAASGRVTPADVAELASAAVEAERELADIPVAAKRAAEEGGW